MCLAKTSRKIEVCDGKLGEVSRQKTQDIQRGNPTYCLAKEANYKVSQLTRQDKEAHFSEKEKTTCLVTIHCSKSTSNGNILKHQMVKL